MGCLYKLTSPSGKSYIGITLKTASERFAAHVKHVEDGRRFAIHNAIRKYGPSNFTIITLAITDDLLKLRKMEREAIEHHHTLFPNGYNLTAGGEESDYWLPESNKRRGEACRRSWKLDYERRCKASKPAIAAMRKALLNPETESKRREKISQTMRARGIGRGINNGASKLSESQASQIKSLINSGLTATSISRMFGVSRRLVSFIKTGHRWSHVCQKPRPN